MKDYVNYINIKVGDMVFMDFSCMVDGENSMVSELALTPDTLRVFSGVINNVLAQIEAKQASVN